MNLPKMYYVHMRQVFFGVPQAPEARGYKTFFMLNSTEHKIPTAHKNKKC